jgi:4-aminobutyrate aminotransferase/(S)-3-amino-2-methylpropionate transaminase
MVKDPATKEPAPAEAKRIVEEAWNRGVILATASALPNVIKIKPPLIIEEAEVAFVLDVLTDCLKVVFPRR